MKSLLLFLVVAFFLKYTFDKVVYEYNMVSIKSVSDEQYYSVRDAPNKEAAAKALGEIGKRLSKLVDYLYTNKSKFPIEKDNIDLLYNRFAVRKTVLVEGIVDKNYTSYTLNKGEKMVFCLRSRDTTERVYDINLLMFVSIHELSHIASVSVDHTPEFKKIFRFILKEAMKLGLYKYQDYSKTPEPYCGMTIDSNIL